MVIDLVSDTESDEEPSRAVHDSAVGGKRKRSESGGAPEVSEEFGAPEGSEEPGEPDGSDSSGEPDPDADKSWWVKTSPRRMEGRITLISGPLWCPGVTCNSVFINPAFVNPAFVAAQKRKRNRNRNRS